MNEEKVKKAVNKLLGQKEYRISGRWYESSGLTIQDEIIFSENPRKAAEIFASKHPYHFVTISVYDMENSSWLEVFYSFS